MARQRGIVKLKGTIGDLNFYESKDGLMAREKTRLDGKRIANDPGFVRTRENGTEFASSATSGKILRYALFSLLKVARDGRMIPRLMKKMTEIKNMDPTSARGLRNVGVAIALPAAKQKLKGFNFNERAIQSTILKNAYSVNTGTGVITINGLIPIDEIDYPQGATHVSITGAWARVDFVNGTSQLLTSNVVNLPINGVSTNVILTPTGTPTGPGTDIYLLLLEFFQVVNTIQYSLRDGSHNSLAIVEVA